MKRESILLTGATGLIGSYLLRLFLKENYKVITITRGRNIDIAKKRVLKILKFWDNDITNKELLNLKVIKGDITKDNFDLNIKAVNILMNEVDELFHCAAATQFNDNLETLRRVNVEGVSKVLNFGLQSTKRGRLKKISYLSTIYVCGNHEGVFSERFLNVKQQFNTAYERSKFEAEELIREYRDKGLWVDIFRPPAVAGESTTGKVPFFRQALYQALHILNLGVLEYFPIKENQRFHMVCIDELCSSIFLTFLNSKQKNMTFHNFNNQSIPLRKIISLFIEYLNLKKIKFVSHEKFEKIKSTPVQRALIKHSFTFLNRNAKIESAFTNSLLAQYGFSYNKVNKKLLTRVFHYPLMEGFLKKK